MHYLRNGIIISLLPNKFRALQYLIIREDLSHSGESAREFEAFEAFGPRPKNKHKHMLRILPFEHCREGLGTLPAIPNSLCSLNHALRGDSMLRGSVESGSHPRPQKENGLLKGCWRVGP